MTTMAQTVRMAGHVDSAPVAMAAGNRESVAKNVMLFFAAPFIGLAYIIVFPLVGAVALVKAVARLG